MFKVGTICIKSQKTSNEASFW